jgi:hypothetical protein
MGSGQSGLCARGGLQVTKGRSAQSRQGATDLRLGCNNQLQIGRLIETAVCGHFLFRDRRRVSPD